MHRKTKENLKSIAEWYKLWGQVYHKTEFLIHTPKGRSETNSLIIVDKVIKQVCSRKLLGVILDENLTYNKHLQFIAGRASASLNSVSHILKHTSCETALSICNALLTTILTTTYPVWCTNSNTKNLESIRVKSTNTFQLISIERH